MNIFTYTWRAARSCT